MEHGITKPRAADFSIWKLVCRGRAKSIIEPRVIARGLGNLHRSDTAPRRPARAHTRKPACGGR